MPGQFHLRVLLTLFYAALAVGAALLLWPWLAPFLLALALAYMLEPAVVFLEKKLRLPRCGAAALCASLLAAALLGTAALLLRRLWLEAGALLDSLPALLGKLSGLGGALDGLIYKLTVAAPPGARSLLEDLLNAVQTQASAAAENLSGAILDGFIGAAAGLPSVGLFLFTALLATFFISASRPKLAIFFRRQIPDRWRPQLEDTVQRLRSALGGWLRAQAILMGVTFVLLSAGLLFLGADLAVLIAGGVALLDALPVFGTGTVLIPWAVAEAFGGRFRRAVGLIGLYGAVWLARTLLEPKLVADRVGLHPLAALAAIYGGFRLFGVAGMILAPLAAVVLKQLHSCGLLKLWK